MSKPRPCLTVVAGPDRDLRLELDRSVVVGTDPDCDVVLIDPAVAARHLRLTPSGDRVRIEALDGPVRYGSLHVYDGEVAIGAVIAIGESTLRFCGGEAAPPTDRFDDLVGTSAPMKAIFDRLDRIATSDLGVLIQGATGTGKELVARAIHRSSARRGEPFVVLDCSAIPRDLIETTLFGHERGAFTGAVARHLGLFEQAEGGTIFLDEIGELDPAMQPRLLRVLENREVKRVGGDRTIKVDARVIAATHRDLGRMVEEGRFREDLYFRLAGLQLALPPLRERREDIPLLVDHFLDALAESGQTRRAPTPDALAALSAADWAGNVRELRNVIIRANSLADGLVLGVDDLMLDVRDRPRPVLDLILDGAFKDAKQATLDQFEAAYLARLIAESEGNVSQAARTSGLTRYHLRSLLKKHGLHQVR